MPLVRCKYYNEEGRPIAKHCPKGPDCDFVHPTSVHWDRAPPPRNQFRGPQPRRGSRGGPPGSFSRGGGTWNSPSKSTLARPNEAGSGWNTSSESTAKADWGNVREDEDRTKNKDENHSWSASSWETPTNVSEKSGGGWGTGSGGGWGNGSGGDWGTGSGGDWGTGSGSDWGNGGGSSWGKADSAWSSGSKDVPTWGPKQDSGPSSGPQGSQTSNQWTNTPANAPVQTWGQSTKDKGKGKEKAAEDVVMREPSPPKRLLSPSRQDYRKKPDLPPVRTHTARSESPSMSPISPSSALKSSSTVPLPTRPRQGSVRPSPAQESLQKRALELAATKAAQETGKIYPHQGSRANSLAPTLPKNYDGPKGRLSLFTDLITHMQDLVIAEIYLRRADAENEQWKRYQGSEIFARASPLTRNNLDAHRLAHKDKVASATKERDSALRALLELPDSVPRSTDKPWGVTKEVVANYAAELRDWLMGLELHKRLLAERKAKEEAEALKAAAKRDSQSPAAALSARQLLERGKWTWKELKDAVVLLEHQIDATSEEVYSELCITFPPSDFDQKVAEKVAELGTQESAPSVNKQSIEDLQASVVKTGENLKSKAEEAATLFNKLQSLNAEIDVLIAEKTKMDEFCAQAEKQFESFEESNKAQQAKIEELTQQLQTLHLHKRPSLRPAKAATPPPPVNIDDILDYIRPIVLQKIEADLIPFFTMMKQRVSENQDEVAKELEQLMKPVLDMTEAICQKVMSMGMSQASSQFSSAAVAAQ